MAPALQKNDALNSPVMLSDGRVDCLSDVLNMFFEYFVFYRWIYFKNRPRGNLLLIRSALSVGVYSFIFFYFFYDFGLVLEGIEIDPVIALAGAVVVGYWNMTSVFHKKSASCANMYLEMIKVGGAGQTITAKLLSNALAIELMTMDLWAHRMYRSLFTKNLYRAIEHAYSEHSSKLDLKLPETLQGMVDKVNSGKLQGKDARVLLDNYHDFLLFKSNTQHQQNSDAQAA